MNQLNHWFGVLTISIFFTCCQSSPQIKLNDDASVFKEDSLPENPLLFIPITSAINLKDSTMSTLYGNEMAAIHAQKVGISSYPAGSLLYEVTWKQKVDSVWFGAKIPKEIISVERLSFQLPHLPEYQLYEGRPLRKSNSVDELPRIEFISSQKMAVSP